MSYRSEIDGQSGQAFITRLMAENGPLTQVQRVQPEVIAAYEGKLPPILLDVWDNYGVGDLAEGRLRLCLPGAFADTLSMLFANDPDLAIGSHVIAYGPFGDLFIWNERHHLVFVGMALSIVDAPFLFHSTRKMPVDRLILDYVLASPHKGLDVADDAGAPMLDRAKEQYGPLKSLQIYGMQPPVPFGEAIAVQNHAIAPAGDWMIEKVNGTDFMLVDVSTKRFGVRPIGQLPAIATDEPK